MRLRLERFLAEELPQLAPFDERAWAGERWRGRDSTAELLADFAVQRQASIMILERLGDADWERRGFQPEPGEFDLAWWVEHWLEHDREHLAQIQSSLGDS